MVAPHTHVAQFRAACPNFTTHPPPLFPRTQTTGESIVVRLNFGDNYLWQSFLGLIGLTIGFNALGYMMLRLSKAKFLPLNMNKTDGKRN